MASINLTIPDAQLPRVRAALCAQAGLAESNANAKEALIQWVKQVVRGYERDAAVAAQPPVVEPDVSGIVT